MDPLGFTFEVCSRDDTRSHLPHDAQHGIFLQRRPGADHTLAAGLDAGARCCQQPWRLLLHRLGVNFVQERPSPLDGVELDKPRHVEPGAHHLADVASLLTGCPYLRRMNYRAQATSVRPPRKMGFDVRASCEACGAQVHSTMNIIGSRS